MKKTYKILDEKSRFKELKKLNLIEDLGGVSYKVFFDMKFDHVWKIFKAWNSAFDEAKCTVRLWESKPTRKKRLDCDADYQLYWSHHFDSFYSSDDESYSLTENKDEFSIRLRKLVKDLIFIQVEMGFLNHLSLEDPERFNKNKTNLEKQNEELAEFIELNYSDLNTFIGHKHDWFNKDNQIDFNQLWTKLDSFLEKWNSEIKNILINIFFAVKDA